MGDVISMTDNDPRAVRLNVLGRPLATCSCDPMTGWFRDGSCASDEQDQGMHVVCCELTEDFLHFSAKRGNDLMTPRPQFDFPGLKPGDHWCLCAMRWKEALEAGCAPKVRLQATAHKALRVLQLTDLQRYATNDENGEVDGQH